MEPEELEPFCSVEGNNDWGYDYPRFKLECYFHESILNVEMKKHGCLNPAAIISFFPPRLYRLRCVLLF